VCDKEFEIRKRRVEELVLSYLSRNPTAEDTVEGILQWWLVSEEVHFRMQEIETALAELIRRGVVIQSVGEDSRVRYRINHNQ
jgi:hypothetical protein